MLVISRTLYDEVEKDRALLKQKASSMTADERQLGEAELEDKVS